jgi:hypothetical protein
MSRGVTVRLFGQIRVWVIATFLALMIGAAALFIHVLVLRSCKGFMTWGSLTSDG